MVETSATRRGATGGVARILVAARSARTRRRVAGAVEHAGFVVCAQAADAASAVAAARADHPDVALLDVELPGHGIAAANAITTSAPRVAVIMLRGSGEDDELIAAFQAGAFGYTPKGFDLQGLPRVLRAVLDGEAVVPRALVTRVLRGAAFRRSVQRSLAGRLTPSLSPRQWQVLELLAEGMSTAEISEKLFIAKVTVRTHISSIFEKLKVPDRAAAVRYFEGVEGKPTPGNLDNGDKRR
jgi:DNA-binding NarL/FixJ family response regulator